MRQPAVIAGGGGQSASRYRKPPTEGWRLDGRMRRVGQEPMAQGHGARGPAWGDRGTAGGSHCNVHTSWQPALPCSRTCTARMQLYVRVRVLAAQQHLGAAAHSPPLPTSHPAPRTPRAALPGRRLPAAAACARCRASTRPSLTLLGTRRCRSGVWPSGLPACRPAGRCGLGEVGQRGADKPLGLGLGGLQGEGDLQHTGQPHSLTAGRV